METSLNKPFLKKEKVTQIYIIVLFLYTAAMVGMCLWGIFAFPGYLNENFDVWFSEQYLSVYNATMALWFALNILSTLSSIYSIRKIFMTTKKLSEMNSNIKMNYLTLILHDIMITL